MTEPEESPNRWGAFAPLGEAIRFLTVLPVPGLPPMSEAGIVRAIPFFPIVGLLIGVILLVLGLVARLLWPDWVVAMLLVVAWGVITAGLHLDGLSDTFDGVMSWRPRERKLEIMKDSRIGAMGALALIALLGLKTGWLAAADHNWWQALLLAPVLGRWADVYGILSFPPAAEGGLGKTFQEQAQPNDLLVATIWTAALVLLIAGFTGMLAMLLVWLVAYLLGQWWTQTLGGLTGDTYGALCEIGETVALAVFAARLLF
jgi:adenosylcobinamide-GDP ribazoletransferase